MIRGAKNAANWVLDHYIVICLLLALLILSLIGVGSSITVGTLGLLLSLIGLAQKRAKVDLWVLLPLIAYLLISMAASYVTYHKNIVVGYTATQSVFAVAYLLLACLEREEQALLRRLCIAWAGVIAAIGIGQFVHSFLVVQSVKRLGGLLGNPNALGIFLVVSWFALMACVQEEGEEHPHWTAFFHWEEPVLLVALALTLSLGSFAAMAAGILVLFLARKRRASWRETVFYVCRILARATLGIGTGIMMYLAADQTDAVWLCPLLVAYTASAMVCWKKFDRFLLEYPWMSVVMSGAGLLVAGAAVVIRPSSLATFTERLAMMRNGLGYLMANPLLGVGPYQWRVLNLSDGDKYFNTYHIHNMFIHIGAELGLTAMLMMAVIAVRSFQKRRDAGRTAQCTAFLCHNLMDTSFFYLGITVMMLLTAGEPAEKGKTLPWPVTKLLFAAAAVMYWHNLSYFAAR